MGDTNPRSSELVVPNVNGLKGRYPIQINVSISEELLARLDSRARSNGTSRSHEARRALLRVVGQTPHEGGVDR